MALLTRAQARSLTQQLIDDPAAKLWSAANLDILIEGALDELWGELLDSFPWLRSTESTALTPAAPGTVNLATALTRFYRLQTVVRNGQAYTPLDARDVLVSNNVAIHAPPNTYAIMGDLLYLFPLSTSADVFVRYNSLPTGFTALASDATPVPWPDGYHLAYVYDAASRAMEKGDREESTRLGRRSEQSLFRLKAFLRKQRVGPALPWLPGSPEEWGDTS